MDGWDAKHAFNSTVYGFTYDDIILMPGWYLECGLRRLRSSVNAETCFCGTF